MQVAVDALAAEAASAPPIGTWDRLRDRLAETGAESGTGSAPSVDALFPDGALSIPPGVRSSDRRTDEASDGGRDQVSADADGALDAARDEMVDVRREPTPVDELAQRRSARSGAVAGDPGRRATFGLAADAALLITVTVCRTTAPSSACAGRDSFALTGYRFRYAPHF